MESISISQVSGYQYLPKIEYLAIGSYIGISLQPSIYLFNI